MFFSLVVRYRIVVIAGFLAVTAFFALQLPKLRMEPDTEAYVPIHHPARQFWQRTEEDFGLGREILVAVEASGPRGIFTPSVLSGIADLSAKLQALEGVEEGQVTSLAQAEAIVGTAEGLEVEPFFSEPPASQLEADAIRERVFQNPMFLNRLVSRDGTIGVIFVTSQHFSGEEPLVIYERVAAVVEGYSIEGCRLLLAGNVAVEAVFGTQMAEDLARLIPLALFVVVVVLFFCFRSISMGDLFWRSAVAWMLLVAWNVVGTGTLAPVALVLTGLAMAMLTVRGVMLPCLVVVIAVTWTWGFQAFLDLPIYIAGTMVPPLLLAIGCADGIHIIERYLENSEFGEDPREIVVRTMEELWRPVVLTSVTTAAGFGALVAGRMTVYQVFGLTTSVGIVAAMFASLTILPALLSLMPLPRWHMVRYSESLVPRMLIRMGELTERYRVATVSAAILVVVLSLACASRLRVDYSWVESLQEGTPVLEADRILRARHGGTSPMNVIISTGEEGGVKAPVVLAAMDRVLDEMSSHPEVGDTRALSEYLKRMNQAMNEDRPDAYRIPASRELVAQYLLLYSLSGDPEAFDDLVDYEYSRANLTVLLRSDRMVVLNETFARMEALLDRYVRPLGVEAQTTVRR